MKWQHAYVLSRRNRLMRIARQVAQLYLLQAAIAVIAIILARQLLGITGAGIVGLLFLSCRWRVAFVTAVLITGWLLLIFEPQRQTLINVMSTNTWQKTALVQEVWSPTQAIVTVDGLPGFQVAKLSAGFVTKLGDRFTGNFKFSKLGDKQQYLVSEGYIFNVSVSDVEFFSEDTSPAGLLIRVKSDLISRIYANLHDPEAPLLVGLLFGGRAANLPDWLNDDLRSSGLSHIASISGFNVSVIVAMLVGFAGLLNRRKLSWVLIPLLIGFLVFIGYNNLPAQRAVFMAVISLLSNIAGRPVSKWMNLIFSLAIMLLLNPLAINSVSLWLSLLAYIGVNSFTVIWASIIPDFTNLVRETLIATLSVYTASVPIFIGVFQSVSLAGLLTNILALPLVPPAMGIGMLAILISILSPFAGNFVFWIEAILLKIVIAITGIGAGLSILQIADTNLGWVIWGLLIILLIVADIKTFRYGRVVKT